MGSPQLAGFCGGKIAGITRHLDDITGPRRCTAIRLSALLENNPTSYHGYAIQNHLDAASRFGTKQDLCDLVAAGHARDMGVILDVVIKHSGDGGSTGVEDMALSWLCCSTMSGSWHW